MNESSAVLSEDKGLLKLMKSLRAKTDAATKRTKIIGLAVLAVLGLGGGAFGYQHFKGPSEIGSQEVMANQSKDVKVLFTVAGGMKTQNRVLLNNFSVPRGQRFAERTWGASDLTIVIDKAHPSYSSFVADQRGRITAGGVYEVVGTASTFNGHPQVIAKTISLKQ